MLERVPHVRPLADALRLFSHALDGLFQFRDSGVQLGELILVVLFDLICGNTKQILRRDFCDIHLCANLESDGRRP